jgi:hypothetical protein
MKYSTLRLIHVVCALLAVVFLASSNAHAQVVDDAVAHVGLGVGLAHYNPTSSDGQRSQGITLAYRWHSFQSGWGPTFGLDWHTTDFNHTLGDLNAPLGSLRMRAILVGYGPTGRVGRFSASANLSGGYSFNGFTVSSSAFPTFATTGVSLVTSHVDNSWVVRPDVTAWYDIFSHVAVGVGAAYLVSRPEQTIITATGVQSQHLKADAFELYTGVTIGVWKKTNKQ